MAEQIASMIFITAAVAAVIAWRRAIFCRRDMDRLKHLGHWRDEFFDNARLLLNDERISPSVVEKICALSRYIDHSAIGDMVLDALREPNVGQMGDMPIQGDLLPIFARMVFGFVLSVGYGDRVRGQAIVERLAERLGAVKSAPEVVASNTAADLRFDDIDCLAAA